MIRKEQRRTLFYLIAMGKEWSRPSVEIHFVFTTSCFKNEETEFS